MSEKSLPRSSAEDLIVVAMHSNTIKKMCNAGLEAVLRPAANLLRSRVGCRYPVFGFEGDDTIDQSQMIFKINGFPVSLYQIYDGLSLDVYSEQELISAGIKYNKIEYEYVINYLVCGNENKKLLDKAGINYKTLDQRISDVIIMFIENNIYRCFEASQALDWLNDLADSHCDAVSRVREFVRMQWVIHTCREMLADGISLRFASIVLTEILRNYEGWNDQHQDNYDQIRKIFVAAYVYELNRKKNNLKIMVMDDILIKSLVNWDGAGSVGATLMEIQNKNPHVNQLRIAIKSALDLGQFPILVAPATLRRNVRECLRNLEIMAPVLAEGEFELFSNYSPSNPFIPNLYI